MVGVFSESSRMPLFAPTSVFQTFDKGDAPIGGYNGLYERCGST